VLSPASAQSALPTGSDKRCRLIVAPSPQASNRAAKKYAAAMCCYGMFLKSSAIAANGESSKEKHVCGDVLLRPVS